MLPHLHRLGLPSPSPCVTSRALGPRPHRSCNDVDFAPDIVKTEISGGTETPRPGCGSAAFLVAWLLRKPRFSMSTQLIAHQVFLRDNYKEKV